MRLGKQPAVQEAHALQSQRAFALARERPGIAAWEFAEYSNAGGVRRANEFFDALPIHQYVKQAGRWHERVIGLAEGTLTFGLAPDGTRFDSRFAQDPDGSVVETCPAAAPYMATIKDRLSRHGGLALIVDYGGWRSKGDTLQALKDHAFSDPLAEPGRADLTGVLPDSEARAGLTIERFGRGRGVAR